MHRIPGLFIIALVAVTVTNCGKDKSAEPAPVDIGSHWRLVESGIGNTIRAIASNDSMALVVGDGGIIYSSSEAHHWTQQRVGGPNDGLEDVARFHSLFIAVGMNGTLVTSPDGENWTWLGIEDQAHLYGLAFGDTLAVAVGESGSIYTSTDGIEWLLNRQDPPVNLLDVIYHDSLWVASGESGTIIRSSDGLVWYDATSNFGSAISFPALTGADSVFFTVAIDPTAGPSSRCQIYRSSDGATWFSQSNLDAWYIHEILWTGSLLVTVGEGTEYHLGYPDGLILSSPDGLVWTQETTEAPFALTCVGTHKGVLLVGGSGGYVLAGTAPNNLDIVTSGANITGAIWTGTRFVAVTDRGTIMQSIDGSGWTESHSHASIGFDRLAFGGDAFTALGGLGAPTEIYYSPDGTNWSRSLEFPGVIFKDITWGNGHFIACGQDGAVFLSNDGQSWSREFVGDSVTLRTVLWDGHRYLAAASNTVYSSPAGVSWTRLEIDSLAPEPVITRMIRTGSQYATVGNREIAPNDIRGYVYTSTDAVHWQQYDLGAVDLLYEIAWTGSRLVVCGRSGTLLTSPTGAEWQTVASGTDQPLIDIAVSGGRAIVVGGNRTVLLSP